jgi:GTPase SAR1 family protein
VDTPGADQFGNLRDHDYVNADICLMVYSIDKETTFERMKICHGQAIDHCKPYFYLIGNKNDLDLKGLRTVSRAAGEELLKELKLTYFMETNAKETSQVDSKTQV